MTEQSKAGTGRSDLQRTVCLLLLVGCCWNLDLTYPETVLHVQRG